MLSRLTPVLPLLVVFALLGSTFSLQVRANSTPELKDLYFGEALFYAYQGEYFDAISRLDIELGQHYSLDQPELGSLNLHLGQAEFSVGDFELSYRMHKRAGRAIKVVIEGDVDEATRNWGTYRLAKIYFQKNQYISALRAIEKVEGDMPDDLRAQEAFLRAQINIANGRFSDSVEILEDVEDEESLEGFATYNLAIALIQGGEEKKGLLKLDKVGRINTNKESVMAIRDKANLVLGFRLLEKKYAELAKPYFERVRLTGPFSNRALLGAGWADMALERFDRVLVPWTILHQRDVTNSNVQEVMMGLPYAYGKLGVHGRAAVLYGKALEVFSVEIEKLDASIKSIREGTFLKALMREESIRDPNWLLALRELEDSPETLYLMDLMASHDFQESLKNYRDLTILQTYLDKWVNDLDAYEEIIEARRIYYEPLLPNVEKAFAQLDSRMRLRLEQSAQLNNRVNSMTISRRPDFLAGVNERVYLDRIEKVESKLKSRPGYGGRNIKDRLKRVKGVISWQIVEDYDKRHTDAYKRLRELEGVIGQLQTAYSSFVRTRQSATQSYVGYDLPISRLRNRIADVRARLETVLARQGYILELMATNELDRRRKHLEEYQIKARFAMAESYDRAQKSQSDAKTKALQIEMEKQLKQQAAEKAKQTLQEEVDESKTGPLLNPPEEQVKAMPAPVEKDNKTEGKVEISNPADKEAEADAETEADAEAEAEAEDEQEASP